jgi:hypothetical protein
VEVRIVNSISTMRECEVAVLIAKSLPPYLSGAVRVGHSHPQCPKRGWQGARRHQIVCIPKEQSLTVCCIESDGINCSQSKESCAAIPNLHGNGNGNEIQVWTKTFHGITIVNDSWRIQDQVVSFVCVHTVRRIRRLQSI